jgi:hypothetical protein
MKDKEKIELIKNLSDKILDFFVDNISADVMLTKEGTEIMYSTCLYLISRMAYVLKIDPKDVQSGVKNVMSVLDGGDSNVEDSDNDFFCN